MMGVRLVGKKRNIVLISWIVEHDVVVLCNGFTHSFSIRINSVHCTPALLKFDIGNASTIRPWFTGTCSLSLAVFVSTSKPLLSSYIVNRHIITNVNLVPWIITALAIYAEDFSPAFCPITSVHDQTWARFTPAIFLSTSQPLVSSVFQRNRVSMYDGCRVSIMTMMFLSKIETHV